MLRSGDRAVNVALAAAALLPADDVKPPAGTVLVTAPAPVSTTLAVTVHVAPPANVPPASVKAGAAVAVAVPDTQVVAAAAGVANAIPLGNASVNAKADSEMLAFELVMVSLSCDTTPTPTLVGLKDLANVGDATIVV